MLRSLCGVAIRSGFDVPSLSPPIGWQCRWAPVWSVCSWHVSVSLPFGPSALHGFGGIKEDDGGEPLVANLPHELREGTGIEGDPGVVEQNPFLRRATTPRGDKVARPKANDSYQSPSFFPQRFDMGFKQFIDGDSFLDSLGHLSDQAPMRGVQHRALCPGHCDDHYGGAAQQPPIEWRPPAAPGASLVARACLAPGASLVVLGRPGSDLVGKKTFVRPAVVAGS